MGINVRGGLSNRCVPSQKKTVHKVNEIVNQDYQSTFGTYSCSDTKADASACKRAKTFPTDYPDTLIFYSLKNEIPNQNDYFSRLKIVFHQ